MESIWDATLLREFRVKSGMIIKKAAEALNITPEYLSMIENAHKTPSQKLIKKMAELYGVQIGDFIKK